MLKQVLYIFTLLFFVCIQTSYARNSNNRILQYNIDKEKFSVIVLVDDGMSYDEAKKIAMKKAADTSRERGYEYFKITSEKKVLVMRGKKNWPSPEDFHQNLYQEKIIERGYNRDRFYHESQSMGDSKAKEAYRFNIQTIKDGKRAYRACDYTDC